ncbi:unnamed protein product, partial [Amoebophrya sp. A120]
KIGAKRLTLAERELVFDQWFAALSNELQFCLRGMVFHHHHHQHPSAILNPSSFDHATSTSGYSYSSQQQSDKMNQFASRFLITAT